MFQDREAISKDPLNLLVNPDLIRKQKPWQVDLTHILDLFIKLLEKLETPDLRLCGSAAVSSVLIYRLKVETLFLFEKLRSEKRPIDIEDLPHSLSLPIRYELQSSTIDELIHALHRLIEESVTTPEKTAQHPKILQPEPEFNIEQYVVKIKENLDIFRKDLLGTLEIEKSIQFGDYTNKMDLLEQSRAFIFILFLAMEGVIVLTQFQEEIMITGAL